MKKFIAGVVVGAVLASASAVYADSTIQAALTGVKFKFDGVQKDVPADYSVISYNGHTYVPARFVAEQLGATVGWDQSTQTVTINSAGHTDASTPQPAPVTQVTNGVTLTVNSVEMKSDRTVFNVTVVNNSNQAIQIGDSRTTAVVDGVQYNHTESLSDLTMYDQTWTQDVQPGASQRGFIAMPAFPAGSKDAIIDVRVYPQTDVLNIFDGTLNIKLK